jgi:hypothetical protein
LFKRFVGIHPAIFQNLVRVAWPLAPFRRVHSRLYNRRL